MRTEDSKPVRLEEYEPPSFLIDSVELEFDLDPNRTKVRSKLSVRRNTDTQYDGTLRLNGEDLELLSVKLNGEPVDVDGYETDAEGFSLFQAPDEFILEIETAIKPEANTSLEGLYVSKGMFCTQCEAEGFRKITYFLDRPDVMAKYRTRIIAEADTYPVLLSNGNKIGHGELDNGRHWVEWEDPFPKPSYLFALVGGNLGCVEDEFTAQSGRKVALRIYVEPGDEPRCAYALDSLKRAMKWDEDKYGREYDLDIFMIVAVSHFNMGAMENKGLNIFNSQYILAQPETATDIDYALIESIIAHEYFHNWTGNRITCRDWFQLCLKEGLTVFRDQQFSADMRSEPVQRIQDIRALRARQFVEDAGPLAHPVRPDTYVKIDNFYTATVYEKGAEVIRMMNIILGESGFRKGMDLYFERHDGRAATVDEFVACMEEANDYELEHFKLWYSQSGTPVVRIGIDSSGDDSVLTLTLEQSVSPTPDQKTKSPLHIPIALNILDEQGQPIALRTRSESGAQVDKERRLVHLTNKKAKVVFDCDEGAKTVSIFEKFSAPVIVQRDLSPETRAALIAHSPDPVTRWDLVQSFAEIIILDIADSLSNDPKTALPPLDSAFVSAVRKLILDESLDPLFKSETLSLPSEIDLARVAHVIDPDAIHSARKHVLVDLATQLEDELTHIYRTNEQKAPYSPEHEQVGPRAFRNLALSLLCRLENANSIQLANEHFQAARNMTDSIAALTALTHLECSERENALAVFYDRWKADELVVNKWFRLQSLSSLPDTLIRVKALMSHSSFELTNPNKVRAVVGAFAHLNQLRFHANSGEGYTFFADTILEIDGLNPQLAARMMGALESWKRFDDKRQDLIRAQLDRIRNTEKISKNLAEIVSKLCA